MKQKRLKSDADFLRIVGAGFYDTTLRQPPVTALDAFLDELRAIPDNASNADGMAKWFAEQDPILLDEVAKVLAIHRRSSLVERLDLIHASVHRLADRLNGWTQ